MPLQVVLVLAAWGGTPLTGDTDPVDTAATTVDTDTGVDIGDTDGPCLDCSTAADLAGDPGGSPCGSGCSTSPAAPLALLLPLALVVARRRT